MEVHHHPEVEKKGFKEYILEGLMIFIAVFMGFIAENIRENITNREHVEQLARQLVEDLKADSLSLELLNKSESTQIAKNDSLIRLLKQPLAQVDKIKMQDLILYCYDVNAFHPATGAIAAIKNELHLKQFSNSKLIAYIADYESTNSFYQKIYETQNQNLREYLQPFLARHFTADNLDAGTFDRKAISIQLRNVTQNDLAQLASEIAIMKIVYRYLNAYNTDAKKKAVALMQYVKKQYNLEAQSDL